MNENNKKELCRIGNMKFEEFGCPNRNNHPLSKFVSDSVNGDVLEAGCGSGSLLKVLQDSGINAEGFDISKETIKVCEENEVKNVKVCSIINFNSDKKYDFILCFNTLHYIRDFDKSFAKLVKLLKKDGKMIVSFGNPIRRRNWVNPVKFWEFWRAIKENNLIIEKVIPQSIFTGGIKSKWICSLNIYILKKRENRGYYTISF